MLGDGSPFDLYATDRDGADGRPVCGVLCIHGFTGSPFEMRYLGEYLSGRGLRALGIALPGHCTTPADLDRTTWVDWYGAVEAGADRLLAECDRVAVVGQSLGGLLALHLAAERGSDLAAAASLAAPLWLPGLARVAVAITRPDRLIGRLVRTLPKLGGSDTRDTEMRALNPCYRAVPVRALHQLVAFMERVRGELEAVRIPTLVVHATQDHTAPFACSYEIAARVADGHHHALQESFHNITIDVEREHVARLVGDFMTARLGVHNHPTSIKERPS